MLFRSQIWCYLSAFRPRGVPEPTSKLSPRVPAQMGRRETEREGGRKSEGDGRERWNPAAFVFVSRLGRVRLQYGVTSVHAGGSERPHASAVPSFPARPTLYKRAMYLPFIGVRRGSRCTMGSVAMC